MSRLVQAQTAGHESCNAFARWFSFLCCTHTKKVVASAWQCSWSSVVAVEVELDLLDMTLPMHAAAVDLHTLERLERLQLNTTSIGWSLPGSWRFAERRQDFDVWSFRLGAMTVASVFCFTKIAFFFWNTSIEKAWSTESGCSMQVNQSWTSMSDCSSIDLDRERSSPCLVLVLVAPVLICLARRPGHVSSRLGCTCTHTFGTVRWSTLWLERRVSGSLRGRTSSAEWRQEWSNFLPSFSSLIPATGATEGFQRTKDKSNRLREAQNQK